MKRIILAIFCLCAFAALYAESFYEIGNRESHNCVCNLNCVNNSRGNVKIWREELGYGMFAINKGDPNGARQRTIYRPCPACKGSSFCSSCRGSLRCTICNGQGGFVTAGYGNYIPCVSCGQTGMCGMCHGTGKCVCSKSEYPGYVPSSTIIVDQNGRVYNSGPSSSSSSTTTSSRSSSKTSRGTCSKCGGRKYERTAYKYAASSSSGWAQPYHNSVGSSCPYCNDKTDHYHYPCSNCRGFGHD